MALPAHPTIPSIPDGGYTRGHFLEFTYGNVIMRETITSEVFHEHSYIGSGSLGIISENMLRRIFGNIPFESATVAAIILPRLRPRVWEEKKMTSFQEKFASIPSEYRSYYPQPHNMDGSGPDTIICNKKRGRPVSVSNETDIRKIKKQVEPKVITASNSVLKYFGSKVLEAIALPSKSIIKSLENSDAGINLRDLKILTAAIVEEDDNADYKYLVNNVVLKKEDIAINMEVINNEVIDNDEEGILKSMDLVIGVIVEKDDPSCSTILVDNVLMKEDHVENTDKRM